MKDIFILKTNVNNNSEFSKVDGVLKKLPQIHQITVDLEDIDKVLRIECENLDLSKILEEVNQLGFFCEELKN